MSNTTEEQKRLHRDQARKKREKNPSLYKAILKKSYLKHRLKRIAEMRVRYRAHPLSPEQRAESLERSRKHYQDNRDRTRKLHSIWAKNNRAILNARDAKRRALEKGSALRDGKLIKEWMVQVRKLSHARCHWCGTKVPGKGVHFDHVVALSKGGEHSISNLCVSCSDCNKTKHNRLIADWICNGQTFLPL